MGKKVKRKTYVSKSQRRSIVAGVREARREKSPVEKALNKLEAWRKGLNPWITVPGPARNMKWVRKRANDVYGDPRATANIYRGKSTDEA